MSKRAEFRLLVATDGSSHANAAVATAVQFPWPERSRVQGLVAKQVPADWRLTIVLEVLDRRAVQIAAGARRELARRWATADVDVVEMAPVPAILRAAQQFKPDVIVVGWRGLGPVRRFLAGSVSRGVIRRARCAVLVVKRAQQAIVRVVVGLDGSANARRAVRLVSKLVPPQGGRVTLFTAVNPMHAPSHALVPRGTRAAVAAEVTRINARRATRAQAELTRAAVVLTRAGWSVRTAMTTGAPLYELLTTVDSTAADLLVVGARGVSGMEHLLLGSVAEGAVNRCRAPVLVVR